MDSGFITLHRKIIKWEWYDDANTFRLFIHLLLNANHAPKKWHGNIIERGQIIVGRINLSKELGLSEQQIRTSLNKLKSTSEITIKTTNRFSLVTLIKYSDYQDKKVKSTSKTTSHITNKQPTDNQQITTNNNVNNDNNIHHTTREAISQDFKPTMETIVYARTRQLPNPSDRQIIDDFINTNQSSNWLSANWQSEYRKFLPKWRMNNGKQMQQSNRKLSAVERVEIATREKAEREGYS